MIAVIYDVHYMDFVTNFEPTCMTSMLYVRDWHLLLYIPWN